MKKLFYLFIGILLILPSVAKADMAAPGILTYKAVVNNPNGIDEYKRGNDGDVKTGNKIPYGTTFEIEDEEYNFICIDDSCKTFVLLEDLTPVEKEYKLKDNEKGSKIDALVLTDVEIKKGPASAYESTGVKIKAGTKITVTEIITDKSETPWCYVEYNGTKGYIDSYGGTIAFNIKEREIITDAKTEIVGDHTTGNVIKTIDANKKLKLKIGDLDMWTSYIYVEYDGVKGFISKGFIIEKNSKENFEYENETKVYDIVDYYTNLDEAEAKVVTTLPANTTVTSEYYDFFNDEIVYYEKDGVKGWIYQKWEEDEIEDIAPPEEPKKEEPKEEQKKEEPKKIVKNKNNYTLYICIGAGILLSLTAIIIVILINKKKKNIGE